MCKLENWLFYFFLFAIPISLRHIFWYEPFNFIEWTAIYVYGTDLLLLILFGFWFSNCKIGNLLKIENWKLKIKPADWFLLAFVIVVGFSIGNAINAQTAVFQWVKLIEGVALYFYVKDYALKRFELSNGFMALVLGGVFQSVIAISQFIIQGSLGFKYLGESPLAPALSGIAAFFVDSIKIMRAYGTTPHPNILALYLFIALGAFYSIAIYQKRAWWWHIFHVLILWAFLLTFSRVIIGLWLITFIIRSGLIRFHTPFRKEFWDDKEMRHRCLKIFWTTFAVGAVFVAVYWPYVLNRSAISSSDEAIQLRVLYNKESLVAGHNLSGLGLGNFVPWLLTQNLHLDREVYQPVHNIYLLTYTETGLIAVALFILFLTLLVYNFYHRLGFKKLYHFSFSLIIVSILVIGLFDHFILTVQSGRLLFWLVMGLLAGAE